jgi:hypothetical protein
MLHAVHGAGDCMASVGVIVFVGFMVLLHCYRASPGSGTTLLRSIDPDCFECEFDSKSPSQGRPLSPRHHAKRSAWQRRGYSWLSHGKW